MSKNKTPPMDPTVIEWLSGMFPDRIPAWDPERPVSEQEIGYLMGQQSVLRRMRFELERQTKDNNNSVTAT